MITLNAYLDTRREAKDGYPVKIRVYDSRTRKYKLYSTELYQKGKTLKQTSAVVRAMQMYQERVNFCNEHDLAGEEASRILESGSDVARDEEIAVLEARLRRLKQHRFVDFYEFTDGFIKERLDRGLTVQDCRDVQREVRNYMDNEPFGLNDITYEWLNGFITYKKKLGTGDGGLSYYLRTLRTIYLEAQRRESLGIKPDNPFRGLIRTTVSAKTKNLRWSVKDVRKLLEFKHPNATKASQANMERVIDLFLFQFAIGGHDLVDVANLSWSNIKEGRVVFQRYKNRNKPHGGEWVDNYLHPFALRVIDKYGDQESDRIFSFLANPGSAKYREQNRYTARTLARISDVLGVDPKLMTKTPRYVFRTLAGDKLVSDLIIETIQGHKPKSITHKYQKGVSKLVQDKEHKQILRQVFGGS